MWKRLDESHLFVIELLQLQESENPLLPYVLLCVRQNVRMNLESRNGGEKGNRLLFGKIVTSFCSSIVI